MPTSTQGHERICRRIPYKRCIPPGRCRHRPLRLSLIHISRECTIQLVQELKFLPLHSRAEFDLLKEFMKHKELLQQRIVDERNAVMECFSGEEREELLQILQGRSNLFDVQRAAAYYKVCRGSFSGTTSSFGVRPNNLTNFLYLFDDASKRLQDVIIENKDCLDIIRERDGPDSLIYCDPPYFDAESLYAVDFPKEKHEELHHILSQCKGYIVCLLYTSLGAFPRSWAFRSKNIPPAPSGKMPASAADVYKRQEIH